MSRGVLWPSGGVLDSRGPGFKPHCRAGLCPWAKQDAIT